MPKITPAPLARPIHEIGAEIVADFRAQGKPVHWSAKPYVTAMLSLNAITDHYFEDDASSVLTYAVSNLGSWRGDTARRVKAEINSALAYQRKAR